MIEFTEIVRIECPAVRVWRALTVPAEVMQWDTGIVAPIDAPPDYPRPGQHVRWRYRLGPLPMVLHDRPTEVVAERTLRSSIQLGPYAFDEIYTLSAEGAACTSLSAWLSLSSHLPLVGPWLERWPGASLARATVRQSLAAIKVHCETQAKGEPA